MTQRASTPSIGGGAGFAREGATESRAAAAMGGSGAYNGGRGYPSSVDDETIGGAYSSQPQAQAPYDSEAYAQYVPYSAAADAAGGYQEATRGYQGQRGYEAAVNYGYAISEPQSPAPAPVSAPPPSSTPARTTAAAALAAAHAAAGSTASSFAPAEARGSAAYSVSDAYGGF